MIDFRAADRDVWTVGYIAPDGRAYADGPPGPDAPSIEDAYAALLPRVPAWAIAAADRLFHAHPWTQGVLIKIDHERDNRAEPVRDSCVMITGSDPSNYFCVFEYFRSPPAPVPERLRLFDLAAERFDWAREARALQGAYSEARALQGAYSEARGGGCELRRAVRDALRQNVHAITYAGVRVRFGSHAVFGVCVEIAGLLTGQRVSS